MKTTFIYFLLLTLFVQCRKESDDCHFFITIKNNSDNNIVFSTGSDIPLLNNDNLECFINSFDLKNIFSMEEVKYRPYPIPDCIENAIKFDNRLITLYLINSENFATGSIPCEEFEERNTILRTYVLTLEDLERLNYTINYPEDASIGVE